jgi:hypothetical protein
MLDDGWWSGSKDKSKGRAKGSEVDMFCFLVSTGDDEAMYPASASVGCRAVAQLSCMKLCANFCCCVSYIGKCDHPRRCVVSRRGT